MGVAKETYHHSFRAMNAMAGAVSNSLSPEGAAAIERPAGFLLRSDSHEIHPLAEAFCIGMEIQLPVHNLVCSSRMQFHHILFIYHPKSMPDIERSRSRKRHSAADLMSYAKPSNIRVEVESVKTISYWPEKLLFLFQELVGV